MTSQSKTTGAFSSGAPADYPVLAVLGLVPVHGYDVWRYLKHHLGSVWQMGRSQVYGLLSQMERAGLVRHERVEQTNLPARKVFFLTAEGQAEVDRWIREPVHHVRGLRLEFPTKLHFAREYSPERAQELVEKQMGVCKGKKAELERARADSMSDIERQVYSYRIRVVDATIGWLQDILNSERSAQRSVSMGNQHEGAS